MRKMKKLARQGDVLVMKIDKLPEGLKEAPRDNGRIVLAYGEVTGHAHAITDPMTNFLINEQTQERFLEVKENKVSFLSHEEHAPIQLPSGFYKVIRQTEFVPGKNPKYVAD